MLDLCGWSSTSEALGINVWLSAYFIKGWKVIRDGVSKLVLHVEWKSLFIYLFIYYVLFILKLTLKGF